MKLLLAAILCCLSAVTNLAAAQAKSSQKPFPDVFFITIDTLRADHLHCYGYSRIQTPTLDGLANHGIRFTEAFTPSPITNTSHTSIFTGLLPSTHGVTDFAIPLMQSHPTLAELLKKHGYKTAAFIGAVILDSKTLAPGLDRGFDFYDNFSAHSASKSRWGRVERRGMDVVQRSEGWLTAHQRGPRFVWIHLYDPHDPYEPPLPYSKIYQDRLYDGEIAYADFALGNFISYLKQSSHYRHSLIIVVGDHGEGLGEHNEETHGIFLYDSTLHVPLIFKLPDSTTGRVVDAQVRTTDILPTILQILNLSSGERFDGESLKPYFSGKEMTNRTALGETDYPLRFGWAPLRSVRAEGSKFIEAPRPELYDLRADPKELTNSYQPWDTNVQKFRKQLADLRLRSAASSAPAGAVGADTLDELRALGYLGASDAHSSTNVPEPSLLPDPKDKIEEQNLLHTAMLAADDGRLSDARSALENVLQLDPQSATALSQLGELELHAGQYEKAARYLKRSREFRPQDSMAAFYEGQALEKAGNLPAARDALETSVKVTSAQFDARLLLGHVYMGLNDLKAAEDQFEAALLLKPENGEASISLAKAQIADSRPREAVQLMERLSRSQPRNAEVFELLANAYETLGEKVKAQHAKVRAGALKRLQKP